MGIVPNRCGLEVLLAGAIVCFAGQPLLGQTTGLGRIDFPNSGSAAAQGPFLRGVAWLHSFEYDEAVAAFREAQRLDPAFALAYWGEALAHTRPLWRLQDLEAGRAALARLAPTRAARLARAPTPRERSLLEAVEQLYGDGDRRARELAYAQAMERLAARFPEDDEIQTFFALALIATTDRGLGELDEGGHRESLVGSPIQARVAAILQDVLRRNPDHPGAAHYLIHVWDDPDHASLAVDVARRYARLAPEAPHALHMPAHVFVQLGLWDEAAASDEAAYAASVAWVARRGLPATMRSYHSLSWLQYAALQQGRLRRAEEALATVEEVAAASGAPPLRGLAASMRARVVVETQQWERLRGRTRFDNSDELFAIGLSAARLGDRATADLALAELRRRATAGPVGHGDAVSARLQPVVAVLATELAAVVEVLAGRHDAGLALAREAARAEQNLPRLGPPVLVKPASELLGELLLEAGQPGEAAAAFEAALARARNRSLAVLGLARALAASGERARAQATARQLLANWRQADPDWPLLAAARRTLGELARLEGERTWPPLSAALAMTAGAVAAGLIVALAWRGRRRGRVPSSRAVSRPRRLRSSGRRT
jgi:tetratricopeptide (TPR) repeat protein